MMDFKTELKRFEKAIEIDDVEESVKRSEESDIMEILQRISVQINAVNRG